MNEAEESDQSLRLSPTTRAKVPPFDQQAFLSEFIEVLSRIGEPSKGQSQCATEYKRLLDAAYERLHDMEGPITVNRIALQTAIRRVVMVHQFLISALPAPVYQIGQAVISNGEDGTVSGIDKTVLGAFYRVNMSGGDTIDVYAGTSCLGGGTRN